MMTDDPIGRRGSAGFPTTEPLQALEKDHGFVKKLFDRYLGTQDMLVKQEAGPELLLLLEMHTSMEEATFYPAVQQVDAALVEQCKSEHAQADQLIAKLKGMGPSDPQCEGLFRQLRDAILAHIDVEENRLFPAIRQSNLDMDAIGLQMAAFEANLVAAQAAESQRTTSAHRPGR